MAVTLRFQSSGVVPGDGRPVTMRGGSLTIGRGEGNDMVLADPDRMVSKSHCVVEEQDGGLVVIDLSTNGTFLNYGKVPLGAMPTRLNDGDILSIGPYELLVEVDDRPAPAPDPKPRGRTAAPVVPSDLDAFLEDSGGDDFLDELIGSPKAPSGPSGVTRPKLGDDGLLPPLGEDEDDIFGRKPDPFEGQGASQGDHSPAMNDPFTGRTGPGHIPEDWDDDDLLSPGGPVPAAPPPSGPSAVPGAPRATPAAPVASPSGSVSESAARAFLKTLGAEESDVPDADLVATMARLGHVLRIMVEGTQDVLRTRSSIKSEFRITQTTIAPRGNNPLKFSVTTEDAIRTMLRPTSKGYLDAPEAARQAMDDVRAHELAMMTGMEAALKGLLARLSPASLEESIQAGGGIGGMLKGKKALYWEAYERMYGQISDEAENAFFDLFAKEFARAYQDQMAKLERK